MQHLQNTHSKAFNTVASSASLVPLRTPVKDRVIRPSGTKKSLRPAHALRSSRKHSGYLTTRTITPTMSMQSLENKPHFSLMPSQSAAFTPRAKPVSISDYESFWAPVFSSSTVKRSKNSDTKMSASNKATPKYAT